MIGISKLLHHGSSGSSYSRLRSRFFPFGEFVTGRESGPTTCAPIRFTTGAQSGFARGAQNGFATCARIGLSLAFLALALTGCSEGETESGSDALTVGLVFDIGGLGDKSFNDAAFRGLERAREELGVEFSYYEPAEGTERAAALRIFASGDTDVILGIGFLFTDDIKGVAEEYPEKSFVCVDMTWREGDPVPANLLGIKFREEEGAFLVGALSGLVTETGTVGFVGGMDIPLIHKFEAGYTAGFLATRPEGRVLVNYAGVTGDAFKNPTKGRELGFAQIDQGADILFHASGSTGLGVFEAARQREKLAIGVDSDQQTEAPGTILTSMTKQVDLAVFQAIRSVADSTFAGGVQVLGLAEEGVDYVFDEANQKWITADIRARVEDYRARIISGEIDVPVR